MKNEKTENEKTMDEIKKMISALGDNEMLTITPAVDEDHPSSGSGEASYG